MVCALLFFGRYIPTYLSENLCPEEGNSRLLGKGSYLTNYTASQTKRLIFIVNNFKVDNFLSSPPFFLTNFKLTPMSIASYVQFHRYRI